MHLLSVLLADKVVRHLNSNKKDILGVTTRFEVSQAPVSLQFVAMVGVRITDLDLKSPRDFDIRIEDEEHRVVFSSENTVTFPPAAQAGPRIPTLVDLQVDLTVHFARGGPHTFEVRSGLGESITIPFTVAPPGQYQLPTGPNSVSPTITRRVITPQATPAAPPVAAPVGASKES